MQRFDYFVLVASLTLLRLPVLIGESHSVVLRLVSFAPLWLVTIRNLLSASLVQTFRFDGRLTAVLLLATGLTLFSLVRTALSGFLESIYIFGHLMFWITVVSFALTTFVRQRSMGESRDLALGIGHALLVYVTCNVALYAMGVAAPRMTDARIDDAAMLALVGIHTSRTLFPLAGGVNAFGTVAGAALVVGGLLWLRQRGRKGAGRAPLVAAVAALAAILLTDARGALVFGLVSLYVVGFLRPASLRRTRWLPFVAPILPILLLGVIRVLPAAVVMPFSRSGDAFDVVTLSNRTTIWSAATDDLLRFSPMHLVGYGFQGQALSGLSRQYGHVYSHRFQTEMRGLHNMLLQNVYDIGYLGTLCLLGLLYLTGARLIELHQRYPGDLAVSATLGAYVYLVLAGTTERVPTIYSPEVFFLLLLICAATATGLLARAVSPHASQIDSARSIRGPRQQHPRVSGSIAASKRSRTTFSPRARARSTQTPRT